MITTAIINLGYYVITLLLLPFPSSTGFDSATIEAFTVYGSYTAFVDSLVPMSVLATSLALITTLELSVFSFKGLRWAIAHLPFVGGRG